MALSLLYEPECPRFPSFCVFFTDIWYYNSFKEWSVRSKPLPVQDNCPTLVTLTDTLWNLWQSTSPIYGNQPAQFMAINRSNLWQSTRPIYGNQPVQFMTINESNLWQSTSPINEINQSNLWQSISPIYGNQPVQFNSRDKAQKIDLKRRT
jgi:hypothetical protein